MKPLYLLLIDSTEHVF